MAASTARYDCAKCGTERPHDIITRKTKKLHTRARRCCTCRTITPFTPAETPGVCCRRCGDVRIPVVYTIHRRPGLTRQMRKCKACKKPLRTKNENE